MYSLLNYCYTTTYLLLLFLSPPPEIFNDALGLNIRVTWIVLHIRWTNENKREVTCGKLGLFSKPDVDSVCLLVLVNVTYSRFTLLT